MAYGNAAYRYDTYPDYAPSPARPDVRVVRGGASEEKPKSLFVTAATMLAVVMVVFTVLCFARIVLTNETVTTLIQSDSLSSQIAEARSTGVSLEMEQSVLSNPSAIKASAKSLGMTTPAEVGTIALTPDVVAVNGDGQLSLSDTVKNVVGSQE